MKQIIASLSLISLLAAPAAAQDDGTNEVEKGLSLLQEGTRLLLEGLMEELGPALEELEQKIDDLNAYLPPEVLPNGDIIIRRKVPLPVPPEPLEEGEIEL